MNILITGVAGFIGYSLAKKLKLNKKYKIYGIDNLNNYYDKKLKINRLEDLNLRFFEKIDISKKIDIEKYFKNKKFDIIIHLAAQAGVRYSLENPDSYISSNIIGTFNLLDISKNLNIKHFIFSSTSSIYGNRSKVSFKETDKSDSQISLYSSSKKSCESILHSYSYNYQIPISILRFFTVYGPWGRPDMALFKFVKALLSNEVIDVYNKGKLWRDFTYIDDLVESIDRLIPCIPTNEKINSNDSISKDALTRTINIGNQKSIKLDDFIMAIENYFNKKFKIRYLPLQKGDVEYTLSNTNLLKNLTNFSPKTDIKVGIKNFCDWYLDYYKIKP
jgi:UDP-glucuronate 4-epimerase